ncbi:MAG: hypothetical protein M4579_005531 [Chaenotheca gracillima]|nr:MAG: hypothetical protein M4579_005531 [Chaenotheca gracillima]
MSRSNDDGSYLALSLSTQAALADFYAEQEAREKRFADLQAQAEQDAELKSLSMDDFGEDWNASQFWVSEPGTLPPKRLNYDEETAVKLAKQLLEGCSDASRIACISAPSVFIQLKKILASKSTRPRPSLSLFEYDTRFAVFKEFVHYDFQHPIRLPSNLKGSFDRVICDPPFLSSDCQTKAALTARWLSKPWSTGLNASADDGDATTSSVRLIVCTGERMAEVVQKLYAQAGIRTTTFEPRHAKGLSNEFGCYANFRSPEWDWR